jgi:hypothetical protein
MKKYHTLPNTNIFFHKFNTSELDPIREEIDEIRKDFDDPKLVKINDTLAGNIKKEYQLNKTRDYLDQLLSPLCGEYTTKKDVDYKLIDTWVNFQERCEFNPMHNHTGALSFVIWISIPYYMKDELIKSPGVNSNNNCSGKFGFVYTDILGNIMTHQLDIDKTQEGTICIFPSKLNHLVYPFYSSDEYRITVSGNFREVPKSPESSIPLDIRY